MFIGNKLGEYIRSRLGSNHYLHKFSINNRYLWPLAIFIKCLYFSTHYYILPSGQMNGRSFIQQTTLAGDLWFTLSQGLRSFLTNPWLMIFDPIGVIPCHLSITCSFFWVVIRNDAINVTVDNY